MTSNEILAESVASATSSDRAMAAAAIQAYFVLRHFVKYAEAYSAERVATEVFAILEPAMPEMVVRGARGAA
jgi:hypothetical protein